MPDIYRAFIALTLPPPVREHLAGVQDCLSGQGVRARWVRPESMHLTLKFLGALPAETVPAVVAALTPVAGGCPPLNLTTGALGAFPSRRKARVLWMGLEGESDRVTALQQAVETALAPLGWTPEKRPFRGHLTLARAKGRGRFPDGIHTGLTQCQPAAAVTFQAAWLTLYRSRLRPEGALYDALHQWRL